MSVVTWQPSPTLRAFQWTRLLRLLALCLAAGVALAALASAENEAPSTDDRHRQQGVVVIAEGYVVVNGGGALCAAAPGRHSYELLPKARARYAAVTRNGGWQRHSAGGAELTACGTVTDPAVPVGAFAESGTFSTDGKGSARLLSAFGPDSDEAEVTSLEWRRPAGGVYILEGSYQLRTPPAHESFRTGRLIGIAIAATEAQGGGLELPAAMVGGQMHNVRAVIHYRSSRPRPCAHTVIRAPC